MYPHYTQVYVCILSTGHTLRTVGLIPLPIAHPRPNPASASCEYIHAPKSPRHSHRRLIFKGDTSTHAQGTDRTSSIHTIPKPMCVSFVQDILRTVGQIPQG